jgi:F-box protein 3
LRRLAYAAWHVQYGRYSTLHFLRASRALATIRGWTAAHFPPVASSLLPGASEAEVDALTAALGLPSVHPAVRVVWRLCAGQRLRYDERLASPGSHPFHESALHGLFPAYAVYDHVVSTRLLTLEAAARHTARCREVHVLPEGSPLVLFAVRARVMDVAARADLCARSILLPQASFNLGKLLFVDTQTADVHVAMRTRSLHRACPPGDDGLLRWLERYAAELNAGQFAVDEVEPGAPQTRAIRAFPQLPPLCSIAVTRGVRVEASATWMAEHSDQTVDAFAYSISFSLLPLDEQQAAGFAPLQSCQLVSRHWVISDASGQTDEVRGAGVIGEHPLLLPGGPPFRYQSQTPVRRTAAGRGGSMLGAFTFVPGSLASRTGPDFAAACALFSLAVPDWVY